MPGGLKSRSVSGYALKIFLFLELLFPLVSSRMDCFFSPEFVLVNVFALVYIAAVVCEKGMLQRFQTPFLTGMLLLLLCYNLQALYINRFYHHWYNGQINVSISILFFMALVLSGNREEKEGVLRYLLVMVIVTNLIGFLPYLLGYFGVNFMVNALGMVPMTYEFGEIRYNWIYSHKSEYAFAMILILSLVVTYRNRYPRKWMYVLSLCVPVIGLLISNTLTSVAAALFIFAGLLADRIRMAPKHIRKRVFLALIPVALLMLAVVYYISRERNLMNLGYRTLIWPAGVRQILKNPMGVGTIAGKDAFPVFEYGFAVSNCHNVFLNILWQYSIAAGIMVLAMLGLIFLVSILKNPSFRTAGIWLAMLIPMNMDWCLVLPHWSFCLLVLYYLFFYPDRGTVVESSAS